MNIENLVFEGGGVKGIAYAGAISVLESNDMLANVKRVAGTSAGAITATLVSLNYDAKSITKIVSETNFKNFEDHWNPLKIPSKFGLYKGDFLLQFIQSLIEKKGLDKNATFDDFRIGNFKDLKVYASDLNLKIAKEFSADTTPNTIVAEAVRASMSIPLFFRAWSFSNSLPNDHLYVDGGLTYNYPITAFDKDKLNDKTLGFHFGKRFKNTNPSDLKYGQILDYIKCVFDMLLESQKIELSKNHPDLNRTVPIDDFGISATNFTLTEIEKTKLYDSGKSATEHFMSLKKVQLNA